jgi:hypothetical protein
MAKQISKIIVAKKQDGGRITIETVDMPPIEKVRQEVCKRYINGVMNESEFQEWMLVLTEMEESLHYSNQVKSNCDIHLRTHFKSEGTKGWLKTITEISDLYNRKGD